MKARKSRIGIHSEAQGRKVIPGSPSKTSSVIGRYFLFLVWLYGRIRLRVCLQETSRQVFRPEDRSASWAKGKAPDSSFPCRQHSADRPLLEHRRDLQPADRRRRVRGGNRST